MSSYLASFSGGDTTVIKINPGEKILIGRYFEGVESSNGTLVRLRSKVISRKHAQLSNLDSKVTNNLISFICKTQKVLVGHL
jgi:pSer/pThr/pTyr-binding forkhead associated (FHA) protein